MLITAILVAVLLFCAWAISTDRRAKRYDEETWASVHSLFVE